MRGPGLNSMATYRQCYDNAIVSFVARQRSSHEDLSIILHVPVVGQNFHKVVRCTSKWAMRLAILVSANAAATYEVGVSRDEIE